MVDKCSQSIALDQCPCNSCFALALIRAIIIRGCPTSNASGLTKNEPVQHIHMPASAQTKPHKIVAARPKKLAYRPLPPSTLRSCPGLPWTHTCSLAQVCQHGAHLQSCPGLPWTHTCSLAQVCHGRTPAVLPRSAMDAHLQSCPGLPARCAHAPGRMRPRAKKERDLKGRPLAPPATSRGGCGSRTESRARP